MVEVQTKRRFGDKVVFRAQKLEKKYLKSATQRHGLPCQGIKRKKNEIRS